MVCVWGEGVQWEAEDEPTARRTGRTPEQAKMARIEKVEVRRIPAQRPEDRRRLQPARQQTRRPICHLASRPGKETVSWCNTISIRMLTVRRCCAYHRTDDI